MESSYKAHRGMPPHPSHRVSTYDESVESVEWVPRPSMVNDECYINYIFYPTFTVVTSRWDYTKSFTQMPPFDGTVCVHAQGLDRLPESRSGTCRLSGMQDSGMLLPKIGSIAAASTFQIVRCHRHLAASPCNGTSTQVPKRRLPQTSGSKAEPFNVTPQQHLALAPAPWPESTRNIHMWVAPCSSTLQQQHLHRLQSTRSHGHTNERFLRRDVLP